MGHSQTRKNTSKQEKNTNKQEKYLSSKGNAFQARGRSFRSRQGGCERWRVDIVYWYGVMRRKPRGTGGGDGVG